ncbi:MAG: chemotaxis protein CheW, partial [Desulfomonile sp.]|nr:chemotaxis protein CheW [Desulfomonile sp.]
MGRKDEEFLKKLLATFKIEADEHLKAIAMGLLDLEKSPAGPERESLVETMYREAHSLKGAARSVNMTDIESVCQVVESVFATMKAGEIQLSTELFDLLHRATDIMTDLLAEMEGVETQTIIRQLNAVLASRPAPTAAAPEEATASSVPPFDKSQQQSSVEASTPDFEKPIEAQAPHLEEERENGAEEGLLVASTGDLTNRRSGPVKKERSFHSETVRIAVDKLDPLLRQVSEMVSVKLTTSQRVEDIRAVLSIVEQWKQKWSGVAGHGRALEPLMVRGKSDAHIAKLVDFLEWNQSIIQALETKLAQLAKFAEADARLHGAMVDELLEDMMNVLMLPCSSLLEMFPKLVRDLARENGKEVRLEIAGSDLEIDRRILEEMKDPLIHLLRNSVDHGIEKPEVRLKKGKPREGTITVAFSQLSGNQIELVVSDDGAGIDVARVRDAAARQGMISEQEQQRLEGQDALSLVFRSEVSTSPMVTNLSGRGLGLAIVREKVENLGGNITVATAPQMGASFRIVLPVTLSTFRGILVQAFGEVFVVPTASVERVARIKKEMISTVGNHDTIEVNGRTVPLVRMGDILELTAPKKMDDLGYVPVLILRSGDTLVAFQVDTILQEQEVLVKGLGKQLSRVRNVAGATVLGSGKLAPILNVTDLIKSATKGAFSGAGPAVRVELAESGQKSVLVVEDSITSRMLLKNILESSGYDVTTS